MILSFTRSCFEEGGRDKGGVRTGAFCEHVTGFLHRKHAPFFLSFITNLRSKVSGDSGCGPAVDFFLSTSIGVPCDKRLSGLERGKTLIVLWGSFHSRSSSMCSGDPRLTFHSHCFQVEVNSLSPVTSRRMGNFCPVGQFRLGD